MTSTLFYFSLLLLIVLCIPFCSASSERTKTGFQNKEQEVINTSAAKTNASTEYIGSNQTTLNGTRKHVSPKELMDSLKSACVNLRIFAESSKHAKDLATEILSVKKLAKEIERIDLGDKCGFTSYSAALRVFLKTCSIIESCPLPRGRPTYEFKLPKGGTTNGQFQPARISQLYVAVPNSYSPINMNTAGRSGNGFQPTSINFNIQPSLPAWIPVVRMMRMQQAAHRAISRRLRPKGNQQESDGTD